MKLTKIIKPAYQESRFSVTRRWLKAFWRSLNKPAAGYNHFCHGESGSGEWSHRSELPSICGHCKEPNATLKIKKTQ